jgi:hypothetical protein
MQLMMAVLLLNSCIKEVQRAPENSPGLKKLKSAYWHDNDGNSDAGYYRYDSQNRLIKYDNYEDSSLVVSYRYIWTDNTNGLTSEAYRIEDGDSTLSNKYYWNRYTGFADSIINVNNDIKVIYQIKLDQYSRPELIERFSIYNSGWNYSCDSIYDGMVVRRLSCNSSDIQDTNQTVYSQDDYTDFYSPYTAIPVANVLNRNAYLKHRKSNYRTYQGISNGFVTKWVYDDGSIITSEEYAFE